MPQLLICIGTIGNFGFRLSRALLKSCLINLLGSATTALASIGLSLPAIAAIAILMNLPLSLGIIDQNITLMYLTFFIEELTLAISQCHSNVRGAIFDHPLLVIVLKLGTLTKCLNLAPQLSAII